MTSKTSPSILREPSEKNTDQEIPVGNALRALQAELQSERTSWVPGGGGASGRCSVSGCPPSPLAGAHSPGLWTQRLSAHRGPRVVKDEAGWIHVTYVPRSFSSPPFQISGLTKEFYVKGRIYQETSAHRTPECPTHSPSEGPGAEVDLTVPATPIQCPRAASLTTLPVSGPSSAQ